MSSLHPWRGVRLATHDARRDPDADLQRVALPTGWGETAAGGFVDLACEDDRRSGWEPLRLPDAAMRWIAPLDAAARAVQPGGADDLGETLHALLLLRQGCPDRPLWRGEVRADHGFVLHLASFADGDAGFDHACFEDAVEAAGRALALASPGGAPALRLAAFDGMFACLGLAYESDEARRFAVSLVQRARARLGRLRTCANSPSIALVAGPAGPAEAFLGVETAGYAPAFSPVGQDGRLTVAARARLAHLGLSPERALALALDGVPPLLPASVEAHAAMHDALAPLLDRAPPRPALLRAEAAPPGSVHAAAGPRLPNAAERCPLPARAKGFTQKVSIGGHRLFLRTAEYPDGRLGEISILVQGRETAAQRALMEAVSNAVSIGLQHGVPLDAYVEAFAHLRFGASGSVDGDPGITEASSPLDYAFRALSEAYLGRHLPDPAATVEAEDPASADPLLPLGLPGQESRPGFQPVMRQRSLRLVSTS